MDHQARANTTYELVLATVLVDFREEEDLTVKQCTERADLLTTQWVRVEKGMGGTTLTNLTKVAKAMRLELGEFFTEVDRRVQWLERNGVKVLAVDAIPAWDTDPSLGIACPKKLSKEVLIARTKFA